MRHIHLNLPTWSRNLNLISKFFASTFNQAGITWVNDSVQQLYSSSVSSSLPWDVRIIMTNAVLKQRKQGSSSAEINELHKARFLLENMTAHWLEALC